MFADKKEKRQKLVGRVTAHDARLQGQSAKCSANC